MSYALYSWKSRRLLVSRPTSTGYGSAVAEILNGFYLAQYLDAAVCFLRPRRPLNFAIFELQCEGVSVVPPRSLGAWYVAAWWHGSHAWPELKSTARAFLLQKGKALLRRRDLSKTARGRIKRLMGRLQPAHAVPTLVEAAAASLEFRRLYVERPLRVDLPSRRIERARYEEIAIGLDPDQPLVTVHVRESTFKRTLRLPERPTDVMRNASIDRYRAAIEYLLARGFQVVRIGDPMSTPIRWAGPFDLATSPARTELLELWCMKRSRFFIASDSGPYMSALLLGVPTLAVNVTALIGGDPLRPGDRYILKTAVDRTTGRALTLDEMLTPEYLINFRASGRYEHLENSGDEILEAVQEMTAVQVHEPPPTPAQAEFDRRLRALAETCAVAEWRAAAGLSPRLFIGSGRIVDAFARRRFGSPLMATL